MSGIPPEGFFIRAATVDDAQVMTDLVNETTRAEIGIPWTTLEEMRGALSEPGRDPEDEVLLLDRADAVRGYLSTRWDDPPACGAFNLIFVHPASWGRGLSTFLVRLGEARVRARLDRNSGGDRCRVLVARFTSVDAAARMFEALGYRYVRTFWEMTIDLDREPPDHLEVDGIAIRTVEPERDLRPVHDALSEAFADHWGDVIPSFERWRRRHVEAAGSGFDPGLWFVAVEDEQIVGAATCRIDSARGDGSAQVEYMGVRRGWRRRGIALVLLSTAFREFRARAIPSAHLGVDAENATGATLLYERAGMRLVYSWDFWEKELRAPSPGISRR